MHLSIENISKALNVKESILIELNTEKYFIEPINTIREVEKEFYLSLDKKFLSLKHSAYRLQNSFNSFFNEAMNDYIDLFDEATKPLLPSEEE